MHRLFFQLKIDIKNFIRLKMKKKKPKIHPKHDEASFT